MKFKYRRVSLRTIKGIDEAERLKARGWRIVESGSGFDTILFEKEVNQNGKANNQVHKRIEQSKCSCR